MTKEEWTIIRKTWELWLEMRLRHSTKEEQGIEVSRLPYVLLTNETAFKLNKENARMSSKKMVEYSVIYGTLKAKYQLGVAAGLEKVVL